MKFYPGDYVKINGDNRLFVNHSVGRIDYSYGIKSIDGEEIFYVTLHRSKPPDRQVAVYSFHLEHYYPLVEIIE